MKVLLSAIACDPDAGSENFVGWQALTAIAKEHDVWVLTSARHRASLEAAKSAGRVPANVKFRFHGSFKPWHPNRFLARIQDWREFMAWQRSSLPAAQAVHREIDFDVVHHVTYSTWRVASPLWQMNVPFVWGPVGGAGSMPARFHSSLSATGRLFEVIRAAAAVGKYSSKLRRCAKNSAHVFVSCADTERLMSQMRGSRGGISILSPGFFTPAQLVRFKERHARRAPAEALSIFAGGNMIGSKGVPLALRALHRAKASGLRFRYTIAGGGPEEGHLRRLAIQLDLHEVSFIPSLKGDAYLKALGDTDIYLLPSFRENIGLTMMEAMLAGAVPVVLDRSAPGEIVTPECGMKVPAQSEDQVVRDLASALLHLDEKRSEMLRLGANAIRRIENGFSDEHYRREVSDVYARVTAHAYGGNRAPRD